MSQTDDVEVDRTIIFGQDDRDRRRVDLGISLASVKEIVPLAEALSEGKIPDYDAVCGVCLGKLLETIKDKDKRNELSYISMYTFDFGEPEKYGDNPFIKINEALFRGTPVELFRVRFLIWGLLKALRSLPYKHYDTLYRGLSKQIEWKSNETRLWTSFTSTSVSKECAWKFTKVNKDGICSGTLICIRDGWGYEVEQYSLVGGESEVLLEPGTKVLICGVYKKGGLSFCDVDYIEGSGDLMIDKIPRSCIQDDTEENEQYEQAMKLLLGKDRERGLTTIKDLSEKGNVKGMIKYGGLLANGAYGDAKEKKEEGYKILQEMEKYYDGGCFYNLGACHELGIGVEKNEVEAGRFYLMSFLTGYIASWYKQKFWEAHTEIYQNNLVLKLFDEVTTRGEGGDSQSEVILGMCYLKGIITKKNEEEGIRLLRRSCEKENSYGQFCLGVCYQDGLGVKKNLDEADKLFKLSADQGNSYAKFALTLRGKK